jgi:Trehalose utilisation
MRNQLRPFAKYRPILILVSCLGLGLASSDDCWADPPRRVVLVAGEVTKIDTVGHHDYTGGIKGLDFLLRQNNVECTLVENGWPSDENLFRDANSVVFYTDGGGKQAFFATPERVAQMQRLVDSKVGLVMIHQAVDVPDEFGSKGMAWLGGAYFTGVSARGHWDSSHVDFPSHPITKGVEPWKINDGWLNAIRFVDGMKGVTPLVWSGKEYAGSRAGLDRDIVSWSYDRPDGGRSFSFTGLDAHAAWKLAGMRKLVINGILWTAGVEIGANGAACDITDEQIDAMLTPREPKPVKAKSKAKK